MEQLKDVFAGNLIRLRTEAGMTQAQLAEIVNYSDKSISKWERAEGLPDLEVTKQIADHFGVTVDYLITSHDAWTSKRLKPRYDRSMITGVCLVGIWTLAVLLFLLLHWVLQTYVWLIFFVAFTVSLVTLLVLNSVWKKERYHVAVVSLLVLSVFAMVYYLLSSYTAIEDLWTLIFLWLPAQLVVLFSFRIRRRKNETKK